MELGNVYLNRQGDRNFDLDKFGRAQNGRTEKRNKLEIYNDILQALYSQMRVNGKRNPSLARTASYVNMPYTRFKQTVILLSSLGLCHTDKEGVYVTEKGVEFLKEYQSFNDYLKKIGLL